MKIFLFFILIFNIFNVLAKELADGKYAIITTAKGDITIKLEYKKAPITVINFAGLALGEKDNAVNQGKKFYDGLRFHRVIPNFMIQGGDPMGNGRGGPGYKFIDEITDLKHDRAGTLSMANSGPNTNGSQFFITHKETPWLDGKHTVFGYVVQGQDIVNKIEKDDIIESITIKDVGEEAENFKTNNQAFDAYLEKHKEQEELKYQTFLDDLQKFVAENYPEAKAKDNYFIEFKSNDSNNKKPELGDFITVDLKVELVGSPNILLGQENNKKFKIEDNVLSPIYEEAIYQLSQGDSAIIIANVYFMYGDNIPKDVNKNNIVIFTIKLNKID